MVCFAPKQTSGTPLFDYQSLLGVLCVGETLMKVATKRLTASTVCRTYGDTSGSSFHAANGLLREPVSRNWSLVCLELLARCPGAEYQQETAELHCPLSGPDLTYISLPIISCIIEYVTNKTSCSRDPEGVASLSTSLCFRAEETERSACLRPLRSGILAGLAVFFVAI